MSLMFETLERLEKESGEVSNSFAEVWSLVQQRVAAEPGPPSVRPESRGLNNLRRATAAVSAAAQHAGQRAAVSWRNTLAAGREAAAVRNSSRCRASASR
jgi:hypothetical protein